jgi:8-oxo-dGTP diphosphatase
MSMPLKWEFPGGKINKGETPEECLVREVREELGVDIHVDGPLRPATHHYPGLTVTLYPFVCTIVSGDIILHEHAACVWLLPAELAGLDWAEADWPVLKAYQVMKGDH